MALDLVAIREALASVIDAAVNTGTDKANVYAYPPGDPTLPAVLIFPRAFDQGAYVTYHGTFSRSVCQIGLRIELRADGNDIDGARKLDTWLGTAGSVLVEALITNPTLGGAVETIKLGGSTVPGKFAPSETDPRTWQSSSMELEIYARRQ